MKNEYICLLWLKKKSVFWLKKIFFLHSRSLKTNNSFLVFFFFFLARYWFYPHVNRANVYESCDTRVYACVCSGRLDAALTLSCFVSSVLFTSQSPKKKRKKKSRQRDEQQLVEAAFEFPTWFSPQLILSFSLFWLPLLFGVYDMCLMNTLINK